MFLIKKLLTNENPPLIIKLSINIKYLMKALQTIYHKKEEEIKMKNESIIKINKMGNVSLIITRIAQSLLILGIILSIIGGIICNVLPKDVLSATFSGNLAFTVDGSEINSEVKAFDEEEVMQMFNENFKINSNDTEFIVSDIQFEDTSFTVLGTSPEFTFNLRSLAFICFTAAGYVAISLIFTIFIGRLCNAFKTCETPFEASVIKKLQHLAYALIPWAVISECLHSLMTSQTTGKINISLNIDLTIVIAVLIILALANVFKYGALLQQESDETL